MATDFPTSLDSLTNPTATDPTTNPDHAAQHANANDAIEALQAKVGIDGSAVATSHDKLLTLVVRTDQDSTLATGTDIVLATTGAGTKIGTGATQLLGFYGATPVVQQALTADLLDSLQAEGLIAAGAGDTPLNLTGGALTCGALTATGDANIGNATTDLVGFHGATATDQCAAYTQTFSTADRTHAARTATALTVSDGAGTNDGTIGAITGDASVIAAVQELAATLNALIVDVADTASVVNAIVDDLQEKGLVG